MDIRTLKTCACVCEYMCTERVKAYVCKYNFHLWKN